MAFLFKRTPVCSRALCDSDDELNPPSQDFDTEQVDTIVFPPGLSFKRLLIGIGPISSAFFVCTLRLSSHNCISKLRMPTQMNWAAASRTRFIFLYYLSGLHEGVLVVNLPFEDTETNSQQKTIVKSLMLILSREVDFRDVDVTILSSQPASAIQASSPPKDSFVRVLGTLRGKNSFPVLERPNIITGFTAEFFMDAYLRGVPCIVYLLFHTPCVDPSYSESILEELFTLLRPIWSDIGTSFCLEPITNEALRGTELGHLCRLVLCGRSSISINHVYT